MLVKKIQLEKKIGKSEQSIYIWFRTCYKYQEISKCWNESQQHSWLSSNRKWYKISSQLGIFCRFLCLPCNQSCAVLHSSHFCIHYCTSNCTGEIVQSRGGKESAGLLSDIGVRPFPLNLRLGIPFGFKMNL